MIYDYLKKVRAVLNTDATIIAAIGANNVRVRELPFRKIPKQITLKSIVGNSNSIIPSAEATLYVYVWISQKESSTPYITARQISERVVDLLNRKGESFNTSDLILNQLWKNSMETYYDEPTEYWVSVISFRVVTND